MSRIDVTEVLTDPDFVGPICHIGRQSRQNSFGENVLTECSTKTVGSVQPIAGNDIQKVPEFLRTSSMMTFFMKGKIVASEPGKYTDILVADGKRYQIKMVYDWTHWGAGYSEGMCVAESPS